MVEVNILHGKRIEHETAHNQGSWIQLQKGIKLRSWLVNETRTGVARAQTPKHSVNVKMSQVKLRTLKRKYKCTER